MNVLFRVYVTLVEPWEGRPHNSKGKKGYGSLPCRSAAKNLAFWGSLCFGIMLNAELIVSKCVRQ